MGDGRWWLDLDGWVVGHGEEDEDEDEVDDGGD